MRLRLWLCKLILGKPKNFKKVINDAYENIWPKHDDYEQKTKFVLSSLLLINLKNIKEDF